MADCPLPLETLPKPLQKHADPKAPPPLRMMGAKGLVPAVAPADLTTLLFMLSFDADEGVRETATKTAAGLPDKIWSVALRGEAMNGLVLDWLAERLPGKDAALELVVLNPSTLDETMARLAPVVSQKLADIIRQNELRLLRHEAILRGLCQNPNALASSVDGACDFCVRNGLTLLDVPQSVEAHKRVHGVDPTVKPPEPQETAVALLQDYGQELAHEPVDGAAPPVAEAPAEDPKKQSITKRIMKMSVSEKIKLATLGNKEARTILLRDSNKLVCMAAATSPRITDGEIVLLANSRTVNADVLRYVYSSREFLKTYAIKIRHREEPEGPAPHRAQAHVHAPGEGPEGPRPRPKHPADDPVPGQVLHDEEGDGPQELAGQGLGGGRAGGPVIEASPPVKVGRAVWLSAATMASRVLGLVRDQIFAILIGANRYSDAFVVAFRIPNLLRDLFAEGALSSAFVPTFADAHRNRGPEAAYRLANTVVGLILVVVGALSLAGLAFADAIVAGIAPGFGAEQAALAAFLTRIMMPFLLLVSLAAAVMGMLNAQSRFTAPALAPALFNVGAIAVGLGMWIAGVPPARAVVGWSIGTLLGGVLQLGAQLPSLRAVGFRLRLRLGSAELRDPGVARIFRLMGAAVIGLSATQVNIVVNTYFASHEVGANTWLQNAFRLMQLPLGVFGVAIATVAGAGVAQRVAARDMASVKQTIGSALRLVAFLNVPSAIGLIVLARPIISLLFEHGRFGAADTDATAQALVFYAVGLYAYSGVKVFAPALYALDLARVAVWGSALGMVSNVALNVALYPVLGFRGVALGTSLAAGANFAVLALAWRSRYGGLGGSGILRQLGKVAVAGLALAVAAWLAERGLVRLLPIGKTLPRQLVLAFGPIAAGAVAYLAAARALGIRELDELRGALRRRRTRA